MSFKLKKLLLVGLGGLGGDVAELFCLRMIDDLVRRYASGQTEARALDEALRQCFRVIWLDSDEREPTMIPFAYADNEPEIINAPIAYTQMTTRSGKEILRRIDEKPFVFLKDWVEARRAFLEKKEEGSEAEANRGFGAYNALENIGGNQRQVNDEIFRFEGFDRTAASQTLVKLGLLKQGEQPKTEIFVIGSTVGGQATGLILPTLALLGLELRNKPARPKIRLHLACSGFHTAKAEALTQTQHFKTLAVLRDLAKIKKGDGVMELPHPSGTLIVKTDEIAFNSVNLHQPHAGAQTQKYEAFVSQFANVLVDNQMTAFAADLRRDRGNAVANARTLVAAAESVM